MIIEIEYYKGDTILYGTKVSFEEFKKQIKTIEKVYDNSSGYDKKEDNFIALLCRIYNWTVMKEEMKAEYIYDRDTKKCISIH